MFVGIIGRRTNERTTMMGSTCNTHWYSFDRTAWILTSVSICINVHLMPMHHLFFLKTITWQKRIFDARKQPNSCLKQRDELKFLNIGTPSHVYYIKYISIILHSIRILRIHSTFHAALVFNALCQYQGSFSIHKTIDLNWY